MRSSTYFWVTQKGTSMEGFFLSSSSSATGCVAHAPRLLLVKAHVNFFPSHFFPFQLMIFPSLSFAPAWQFQQGKKSFVCPKKKERKKEERNGCWKGCRQFGTTSHSLTRKKKERVKNREDSSWQGLLRDLRMKLLIISLSFFGPTVFFMIHRQSC